MASTFIVIKSHIECFASYLPATWNCVERGGEWQQTHCRWKVLTYGICYLFCHGILHPIYGYLWQYHKNQRLRLLMMVFFLLLSFLLCARAQNHSTHSENRMCHFQCHSFYLGNGWFHNFWWIPCRLCISADNTTQWMQLWNVAVGRALRMFWMRHLTLICPFPFFLRIYRIVYRVLGNSR